MLRWNDDYLIGEETIDKQHEELFRIAGEAFDLLKNDFYVDKYDKIVDLIHQLKKYAVFHFETEEKYMLEIGYKKFFSHKAEHEAFIDKVKKLDLEEMDENQDEYLLSIIEFAINWIDKHILHVDKSIMDK